MRFRAARRRKFRTREGVHFSLCHAVDVTLFADRGGLFSPLSGKRFEGGYKSLVRRFWRNCRRFASRQPGAAAAPDPAGGPWRLRQAAHKRRFLGMGNTFYRHPAAYPAASR